MSDDLSIDLSVFEQLPKEMQGIALRVINNAAHKGRSQAVALMRGSVNLPAPYIRDKLQVVKATRGDRIEAVIRAERRPVLLSRFGARQLVKAAKRAKGDPRRGIAKGKKQAGVSVKVKRSGGRKTMRKAFLIPLQAGELSGGNGLGVAIRTGKGKDDYRVLYGPSVDQMFKSVRGQISPGLLDQMLNDFLVQLEKKLA